MQRERRLRQAADHLRMLASNANQRLPRHASPADLGIAATQGERRAAQMGYRAWTQIGLAIGVELVRSKIAAVTKTNRFQLLPVSSSPSDPPA